MIEFVISFVIWAVLHSLTAGHKLKGWFRRQWGEAAYQAYYRLVYNVFAVISILPVLYVVAVRVTAEPLWQWPSPWHWLAQLMRLVGLAGLGVSLWQTDVWEFLGIRQVMNYWRHGEKRPLSSPQLVTTGTYALVRHPLYFFSLLFLWFTPVMTLNNLLFNLLATAYFWIGSIYEEHKLADQFGPAYKTYQQQVPRLLPGMSQIWRTISRTK